MAAIKTTDRCRLHAAIVLLIVMSACSGGGSAASVPRAAATATATAAALSPTAAAATYAQPPLVVFYRNHVRQGWSWMTRSVGAVPPDYYVAPGKPRTMPAGDGRYCRVIGDNTAPEPWPEYLEVIDRQGTVLRRIAQVGTAGGQHGSGVIGCSAAGDIVLVQATCVMSACELRAYRYSDGTLVFDRKVIARGNGGSGYVASPDGRLLGENAYQAPTAVTETLSGRLVARLEGSVTAFDAAGTRAVMEIGERCSVVELTGGSEVWSATGPCMGEPRPDGEGLAVWVMPDQKGAWQVFDLWIVSGSAAEKVATGVTPWP